MQNLLPYWTVHCDGSAIPNPGRMGLGAVWTAPDGTRHSLSHAAPGTGCNNEAEVRALMAALQALQLQGADGLLLHCDNSVVVEQVSSSTAKPIARLANLFDEARALLASFADAQLVWIPGHRNGEADALARAALGMREPRVVKARKKRR
jgi:ribonuclease HI